jgi:hypothetical protein
MKRITDNPTSPKRPNPLTVEELEQRIGSLIGHYLRSRSPAIALSVARHIEALCSHPDFEGDTAQRCVYLRMRAHWRWLAQTAPAGPEV